jgi:hypothetical protein
MRLVKDALKQIQDVRIKGMVPVTPIQVVLPQTKISRLLSVMNVELGVDGLVTFWGKNRASLMDEFTTQDI